MKTFPPGIIIFNGVPSKEVFADLDKATHEWEMRAARGECEWICAWCCSGFPEGMPDECPHNAKWCTELIQRDKMEAMKEKSHD